MMAFPHNNSFDIFQKSVSIKIILCPDTMDIGTNDDSAK